MKRILKRTAALLMAFVLLGGFVVPLKAEAAVKKITAKTSWSNSPKLNTGKNYLVTAKEYKKSLYYVRFTAPKNGTYVFTFKDLTKHGESTEDVIMNGTVGFKAFQYDYEKEPSSVKLKQGKEETYSLSICSRYSWSLHSDSKTDIYAYLPERQAKLKMSKGQTIYISFNFIDKCDVELNIKKK